MTGLVLKLSYNNIGETPVTGGICGSFFFVRQDLAVTANYVLNKVNFRPNDGFSKCQFWLIAQPNIVIELTANKLIEHPEIDTTFIQLQKSFPITIRKLSSADIEVGIDCFNEGFVGGHMPSLDASWGTTGLIITSCSYNGTAVTGDGYIKSKKIMTVSATDINMINVKGFETSYGGVLGMSGGPLISKQSDEIIGLMSIGLPEDIQIKNSLFAVSIDEIKEKIKNGA
jgi:hypothetical protein